MLSSLILDNFKAFGTRQVIPLAPITLIFGANSAGKTSILQALLLLKQTLAQSENQNIPLLPKGTVVDLGSFRELVFNHDIERVAEIGSLVAPDASTQRIFEHALATEMGPSRIGAGFCFSFDKSRKSTTVDSINYYWNDESRPAFRLTPVTPPDDTHRISNKPLRTAERAQRRFFLRNSSFAGLTEIDGSHAIWKHLFESSRPQRERYVKMLGSLVSELGESDMPYHFYIDRSLGSLVDLDSAPRSRKQYLKLVTQAVQEMRSRFSHYDCDSFLEDVKKANSSAVFALRNFLPTETAPTSRALGLPAFTEHYFAAEDPWPNLTALCEQLSLAFKSTLDNLVYLGPLREYPERHYIFSGTVAREVGKSGKMLPDLLFSTPDLVDETNRWLGEFSVGYSLEVDRHPDTEDVFALRFIDNRTQTKVSMLDVGFGISQVLPVIVQSMLASRNLILIEQPEIHLHPRLQADLGSLFAQSIRRQNQFIVETHSEHLILRLQRLLRKGEIHASDISVIYVTKEHYGSQCHVLRLDRDGDFIDEWPEGFFEESYKEMFVDR